MGIRAIWTESQSAMLEPEKRPVRIPTVVMPIWTVERNLSGAPDKSMACWAFLSPRLASPSNLDLFMETSDISDNENQPFSRIRPRIMKISIREQPIVAANVVIYFLINKQFGAARWFHVRLLIQSADSLPGFFKEQATCR